MSIELDLPPPYESHDPLPNSATWNRRLNQIQPDIFNISCPTTRDYQVHSEKYATLFVRVHRRNFTKPNLVIYLRDDDVEQDIAHCEFREKIGQCDMGVSKSSSGESSTIWWSDTDRSIPVSKMYRFSAKVQPSGGGEIVHKIFIWKRTSGLELVDEATSTIAAVAPDMRLDQPKLGSLEVLVPYGPDFNLIALTTLLTVCERLREEDS
ncbi:hypothetical protein N7523_010714 [Penicillium sp. IBT 18751x]|nr:hypothetical protein N7523_010714 [Penicillium sp. IBT 18751x]